MKRVGIFVILIGCFVSAGWAQQTAGKDAPKHSKSVYYDTFNEGWLDPTKWLATDPNCWFTLECVREIQNGRLRLALRSFGATDSDWGSQTGHPGLSFVDPNGVNSITADVTVHSFSGVGCSSNHTEMTHAQVQIGGYFFNTGSGDHADDVLALLMIWIDTSDPKTMSVYNVNVSQGDMEFVDSYPIGTPLTVTFAWDKAKHQFVAAVKVKGEPGSGEVLAVPYAVSDTTPPAYPWKALEAAVGSLNCTSAKTFAQVEAFYDNVAINQPAP